MILIFPWWKIVRNLAKWEPRHSKLYWIKCWMRWIQKETRTQNCIEKMKKYEEKKCMQTNSKFRNQGHLCVDECRSGHKQQAITEWKSKRIYIMLLLCGLIRSKWLSGKTIFLWWHQTEEYVTFKRMIMTFIPKFFFFFFFVLVSNSAVQQNQININNRLRKCIFNIYIHRYAFFMVNYGERKSVFLLTEKMNS